MSRINDGDLVFIPAVKVYDPEAEDNFIAVQLLAGDEYRDPEEVVLYVPIDSVCDNLVEVKKRFVEHISKSIGELKDSLQKAEQLQKTFLDENQKES